MPRGNAEMLLQARLERRRRLPFSCLVQRQGMAGPQDWQTSLEVGTPFLIFFDWNTYTVQAPKERKGGLEHRSKHDLCISLLYIYII